MSGSVNRVFLIGNLGRDPEVRHTDDGMAIVNLSLATSDRHTNPRNGQATERTEWHRVVVINEHLAQIAQKYLRRGSRVYVTGQLQTRKWTDQSGEQRCTTDVLLQSYRGELRILDNRATAISTPLDNSSADRTHDSASHQHSRIPTSTKSDAEDDIQSTLRHEANNAARASERIQHPKSNDQLRKKPQAAPRSTSSTTGQARKKKPKFWSPPVPKPVMSSPTPKRPAKSGAQFIHEPLGSREDFKKDSASNWSRSRRPD